MEIVLFACLMIVPIISVVSLGLSVDNSRKIRSQKKLVQKMLVGHLGNEKAELVAELIDGE